MDSSAGVHSFIMKPVLVSGSLAFDRIMDFPGLFKDHFLKDALHSISVSFSVGTPKENYGGCSGNIAYSLALAGGSPEIAALAGCDFDKYDEWLTKHGVSTDSVQVLDDIVTSSAYIITDQADNQITAFSASAGAKAYDLPIDTGRYALAIVGPASTESMMKTVRDCRAGNLPYVFDPGQQIPVLSPDDLREAIESAKGVILNDYESKMVSEKTGWSENDIAEKAEFLVVTLGAEGSRILTKDGEQRVDAVKAEKVVDPTGAGDAYRGGFLRGLSAGLSLPVCARLGSAVAAYAVECYGTQNHTFTMAELKDRFEKTYNESFPL
jgi:adenosine kinase